MDDLKEIIQRAETEAEIKKEPMVVGQDGDQWYFVPQSDFSSDSVRPGIIVDAEGIRYPEHQALIEKILLGS